MNTPNPMQALRRPLRDYAARRFRFTASEDGRVRDNRAQPSRA